VLPRISKLPCSRAHCTTTHIHRLTPNRLHKRSRPVEDRNQLPSAGLWRRPSRTRPGQSGLRHLAQVGGRTWGRRSACCPQAQHESNSALSAPPARHQPGPGGDRHLHASASPLECQIRVPPGARRHRPCWPPKFKISPRTGPGTKLPCRILRGPSSCG